MINKAVIRAHKVMDVLAICQTLKILWYFEILIWESIGNPKMCNILKTTGRRAKQTKIWASWYYSAHSEGGFHARFLEFGLGSFGAFCKISNFTICSSPNFYLISSKLYTRYPNHGAVEAVTVLGDLPKIIKLIAF